VTGDSRELLNDNQRRSLSVMGFVLEGLLRDIEELARADSYDGEFLEILDDLPDRTKEEIINRVFLLRKGLRSLVTQFHLTKRTKKKSNVMLGNLNSCWEMLAGSHAKDLGGYGNVAEGLGDALDPHVEALISQILDLEKMIQQERNPAV